MNKTKSILISALIVLMVAATASVAEAYTPPPDTKGISWEYIGPNKDILHEKWDYLARYGEKSGIKNGWKLVFRKSGQEESILELVNVKPEVAAGVAKSSARVYGAADGPLCRELLSINGIPWQAFESQDYPNLGREIREQLQGDNEWPFSDFRQELPTGNMVSVYRDCKLGATYTAVTVNPSIFSGKPYADKNSGRLMIPLRGVIDYLGADIGWDKASKTVLIKANGKEIRLKAGETNILVNGKTMGTDTAPAIKNGVTFIPLRLVSEQLGYKVKWYGDKPKKYDWQADVPRADIYS